MLLKDEVFFLCGYFMIYETFTVTGCPLLVCTVSLICIKLLESGLISNLRVVGHSIIDLLYLRNAIESCHGRIFVSFVTCVPVF